MEFKGILFLFVLAVITLFQNINALPRDSGVVKSDLLPQINTNIEDAAKQANPTSEVPSLPGRLKCAHEEATEDASCQEHCLPKGYSYGICVSGTCSCI
ncbi:unnamed protein product, partial [Brenthis ino]